MEVLALPCKPGWTLAGPSRGSNDRVKCRSCLQLETKE